MNKCVFVIDGQLPLGLIANTAAVLAASLGQLHPDLIGIDLQDKDGNKHVGITTIVMPILRGDANSLSTIRKRARAFEESGLQVIDVTDAAQQTKTYEDYMKRLGATMEAELRYLGLCLYGPADTVKSLTGSLPLLK